MSTTSVGSFVSQASMCGVNELTKPAAECQINVCERRPKSTLMEPSISLLELAANNDVASFKKAVEKQGLAAIEESGSWYCRQFGSNQMVWRQRTPAMIASLYGSVEVLKFILNQMSANINEASKSDGYTALHCAAASGSQNVMEILSLLLSHGADPSVMAAEGLLPTDMIVVSPKLPLLRIAIEKLLHEFSSISTNGLSSTDAELDGLPIFADFDEKMELKTQKTIKIRDYPADAMLPDIKHSSYSSDEFRMFSFKVRPCSRAYSHDWTECPFAHPGENARRRDPRKHHYSCVPCPEFRKGACKKGDGCEYAHGVFECWLHPAQYRTRLCKDGTSCARRVCFFAHAPEELRPLFPSTGSAIPSPRTSEFGSSPRTSEFGSAIPSPRTSGFGSAIPSPRTSEFSPPSPSSFLINSNFSSQNSISTPPSSPNSLPVTWTQPALPSSLLLPSISPQPNRLRTSLSSREALFEELNRAGQFLNEIPSLSTQARLNAAVAAAAASSGCSTTSGKCRSLGQAMTPTNFEDLFAAEVVSSPRSPLRANYQSQVTSPMQSPTPFSRVHRQMQSQTGYQAFSPSWQESLSDPNVHAARSSSFSLGSLSHMSETSMPLSKTFSLPPPGASSARAISAEKAKRSQSSKVLGSGLSYSDWGSPTGKAEWGINGDDLSELRKSSSFGSKVMDEPDLSWVQKLIKDGPIDYDSPSNVRSLDMACNGLIDTVDHSILRSWMEQMQLNQIVA